MGEMVEFPSNGKTGQGYMAGPEGGAGLGLIVIQEWWGLVDHIKEVCDRFATEGFTTFAPDLYHGESTTEPDEAGKLMMAVNIDRAVRDMGGAVDYLLSSDRVRGNSVGVIGFCMGGGLALKLAVQRPDAITACVAFYGIIPWENATPDWSPLRAKVQGHFAEKDETFAPDKVRQLEAKLKDLGKDVEIFMYDADHAFFNDTRPEVHDPDASHRAWTRTLEFLRSTLG